MPQTPAVPTSYLLTLNGSVQNVATALGLTFPNGENSIAELHVQAGTANAAVALIGGADVSANGTKLPIPTGAAPGVPLKIGPLGPRQLYLSQLSVQGANNETLRLFVIPYNV